MDDRPNSRTVLKGRLAAKDLEPFTGGDALAQQVSEP